MSTLAQGAVSMTDSGRRAYLDAALDAVIMADASGAIVEFNPAAERTFGYRREEVLGRALAELIVPPSLRQRHELAFARFAATRNQRLFGRRLEMTGMRADGSEFPVELALSQVEGEPLLICGAVRDISDAKQAEYDLRRLAEQQSALRRVATLVAEGAEPQEVFVAVAKEVGQILGVLLVSTVRFEPDGTATQVASWGHEHNPFVIGARLPLEPQSVMAQVLATGQPARIEDYEDVPGSLAAAARNAGMRSAAGVPIIVKGETWGAMIALSDERLTSLKHMESRLAEFTELMTAAISNTQAHDDLLELSAEQAALRRVATLVARRERPEVLFDAVCAEIGPLIGAENVKLASFSPDGSQSMVASWSARDIHVPTGAPLPFGDEALARAGAPVVVEGRAWGSLLAAWDSAESAREGTEERLARFAELVATAISNAALTEENARLARERVQVLEESRARVLEAHDDERRRLERNLHDGAQQGLISIGLELEALRTSVLPQTDEVLTQFDRLQDEIDSILDDVREISRGLHPPLLSNAGLGPALRALARRSQLPVELDLHVDRRLAQATEIAAYYVISEALANAAKHSQATFVRIGADVRDDNLRVAISDDGIGGARPESGSGLIGLVDRVEARGGRVSIESVPGNGTTISIELPIVERPRSAGIPRSLGPCAER